MRGCSGRLPNVRAIYQALPPFLRRIMLAALGLAPLAYLALRACSAATEALAKAQGIH